MTGPDGFPPRCLGDRLSQLHEPLVAVVSHARFLLCSVIAFGSVIEMPSRVAACTNLITSNAEGIANGFVHQDEGVS